MCNCGRRHHEEQFCDFFFVFGPVVHEEMLFKDILFKDISYLELWRPFCTVERNHLCNFGRGYFEEQFCEIILNLGQWFRCCLKDFLSGALVGPPVQWSGMIYAILKEGIMWNIHVKLYEIRTSGSGGDVV